MTVPASQRIFVGIDVGGTFTDLTIYNPDSGQTRAIKVPSNRAMPDDAVLAGLEKAGVSGSDVHLIVHGTTVATNALLERRGARTAFVTTKGFRDVLELGRTTRLVPNSLYDPFFKRPQPLVRRRDRRTVDERIEADGRISTGLDEQALQTLGAELANEGIDSVAIGFVNSYRNPAHERRAAEILARYLKHVTISTNVLNEIREFERFSVVAINGYVMPVMASYITRLTDAVRHTYPAAGFYTVASHGGLLSTRAATTQPVKTVLSGPAAGLAATLHLARAIGMPNLITYDMGGTSTDVALVADATFPLKRETLLEGLIIRLPQLDIHTVGAGGGSIAAIDAGGSLLVGPESAGAVPGPAAYDKGGARATVTDANVALRRLGASQEMGRSLRINAAKADDALRPLAQALGISVVEAGEAIIRLAVAKMASAVHEISVARGFDPRDFALLAYGGAGPLHAALVAEEIGIPHVIVPPAPGAFSAFGALCSALAKDRSRTILRMLDDDGLDDARTHFAAMRQEIEAEFAAEGADQDALVDEYQFDLRYRGQAHELTISCAIDADAASIVAEFESVFERQFGRRDSGRGVEVVNIRLIGRIAIETPSWRRIESRESHPPASRAVAVDGHFVECPVWNRDDLTGHTVIAGPAIIEEMSATTYVPPNWEGRIGSVGELTLRHHRSEA